MKISVNDQELFTLSDIQKKVICNDIMEDLFDEDMKRRLCWVLMDKYKQCYERLEKEWMPKLAERGIETVPLDKDKFAELVFSQSDYCSRKMREKD